jgi:hypothetical protein
MVMSEPQVTHDPGATVDAVATACFGFVKWLDQAGYSSYDPYDIWGTPYGLWSRKVYYAKGRRAVPLVAPLVAVDLLCPSLRRLLVKKERFATCDAQLVLAFLNLHHLTGEMKHLDRAVALGEEIMGYSISGYSGPCWGYPFDWQNSKDAVWPKNTPYITCTPYCYEAYLGLNDATGEPKYLDWMERIAEFVFRDLKEIPVGSETAAGSYSPFDARRVVNASAYRAWLLAEAGRRFSKTEYQKASNRNLNFVLESQAADGSWLYAMGEGKSYIDNFHTCFNLKNLFKIHRISGDSRIELAIRKGYGFYRDRLIDSSGDPRPFAWAPRLQLVKLEMYDFAEGITLGTLLEGMIPEAGRLARDLAMHLILRHRKPDGHFVTRVYRGGFCHRFPFLRWPQAQLFYALTNLWLWMRRREAGSASE